MVLKGLRYALLEFAINGIEVFLRLYLLIFYTERVGLDSYYVGLALGLSIFVDAMLDPLIGSYVDNYKAKNKQRYNLIAYGIGFLALSLFGYFNPPLFSNSILDFFYLLIVSISFNVSYSFVTIPYSSAVSDITNSNIERQRIIGWKSAVGNFGAFIGIGIPGIFLLYDAPRAFQFTSLSFMMILFVCFIITYRVLKKNNKAHDDFKSSRISFELLVKGFSNKFVILFMTAFFVANIGLTINSTLAIYFYKLRLKFSEEEIQVILGSFLIFASIFVPFWSYIAKKINRLYLSAWVLLTMGLLNCFIYIYLPQGNLVATLFFASFLGGFLVSVNFLLESVLTDFIFDQELKHKQEKMGFYYSLWKMNNKISRGIALVITGFIVDFSNIKSALPDENFDNLAYAFGPGVGIFFILSCLLLLTVPQKYVSLFKI